MVALNGLVGDRGGDFMPLASDRDTGPRSAPVSLGVHLHWLRRKRGLSLDGLAQQLGVSKVTVWAWEKGKCRPQPSRIPALAAILGAEVDELERAPLKMHETAKVVEERRQRIASAYGTEIDSVRIMVEI
jgi:transcriptional regulator with XRE-family HTH domain